MTTERMIGKAKTNRYKKNAGVTKSQYARFDSCFPWSGRTIHNLHVEHSKRGCPGIRNTPLKYQDPITFSARLEPSAWPRPRQRGSGRRDRGPGGRRSRG